jgi:DhnA family fructose-bisphosphate aldolase class Ia
MGHRVQEILSWYGSDNPGTLTNLARLSNHGLLAGIGKLIILPVDQGFEHGPARSFAMNPPAYDPRYHFRLAIHAGGGFGSIMGRNTFQRPHDDAVRMIGRFAEIYASPATK